MDEVKKEILKVVDRSDYIKGLNYDEDALEYISVATIDNQKRFQFLVHSESSYRKYMVQVDTKFNEIKNTFCTCPQFNSFHSCKHVAACLVCYSDKILNSIDEKNVEKKTKLLFDKLAKVFENDYTIKKEVLVVPSLTIENSYYYDAVSLKVKIGEEKLYALLNKFNSFRLALKQEETYYFGTNFTYDPQKHFFSEKSEKLFQIISNLVVRRYTNGNSIVLDDDSVKDILNLYKEGIEIEEYGFCPREEGFPIPISLSKEGNQYKMIFQNDIDEPQKLTEDYEYVYFNQKIYHLNKQQRFLLKECKAQRIKELQFQEKDFPTFQKSLFRVVKDHIEMDSSLDHLIMEFKPDVHFYFDLNEDDITCIPKFVYKGEEVSYFEEKTNIIRDVDYEKMVVQELVPYGFQKGEKEFVLFDFDLLCEFMDGGLEELSEKYSVYTSEKLKDKKVLKKNNVVTHFTIGQDQILHYDFNLEGVSNDELDSILSSIKGKKKYYRLKNGNILSLDQKNLKELSDLTTELELNGEGGTIPKYRALYLDSLREKKYGIIKTDSLFQNFINQFKTFQNVNIDFTKEEESLLRDYQKDGVKWLYTICKCGFGGILADEMGLGKSLQTILFFSKLLEEDKESKFLIVCPTSLVYNWENEFNKFAPSLKYQVFAGNRNERRKSLEEFKGSVYITSYGLLREDIEFYKEKTFEVFVIDEAQNIKNPKTGLAKAVKSIGAKTKMALTGTPIENSIVELWSIFDFIMPGFLSSLVKFQERYKIKDFDEETNTLLANLKEQIKPFILRRKKKDVIKDLPDKIENNIYIDLDEEQKKLYAAEVKYANEEMDKLISNGGFTKNKMIILSLLTRLRQICIDPRIIIENYKGGSAKIENLIKIVKEVVSNGHKILLFTSFKTALELVRDELDKEYITSYTIAGDVTSKKRQMLVDAFNKDQTNVFLIMLKSGGTGLNLTSADVVIHLDLWWNPQAENQATDRTHRIGQTKTVEVIKLISKGTIEEKILKLQEKKKILSDKMIEEDMENHEYLKNMTEEDIRDLLAYENKE